MVRPLPQPVAPTVPDSHNNRSVRGAGGNLIASPPVNVTVVEGERAELECLPKEPEAVVQWRREGAPVGAGTEVLANGSLVVRHADSAHLGKYECVVQAPDGATQSAAAFLDVQCA